MNSLNQSLVLMNYFPDNPSATKACRDNSASLISSLRTCHSASGNRWPNFIAVDFYKVGLLILSLHGSRSIFMGDCRFILSEKRWRRISGGGGLGERRTYVWLQKHSLLQGDRPVKVQVKSYLFLEGSLPSDRSSGECNVRHVRRARRHRSHQRGFTQGGRGAAAGDRRRRMRGEFCCGPGC